MESQKAATLHEKFAMPLISISKAAKLFDVSRPTLQKALKDGTISGKKVRSGGLESWQIDTAELARVYSLRQATPVKDTSDIMESGRRDDMEKTRPGNALSGELSKEMEGLSLELARVRADLEKSRADQIEAQRELAAAQAVAEERKRLLDDVLRLLPPPAPTELPKAPSRKTWWPWRRS